MFLDNVTQYRFFFQEYFASWLFYYALRKTMAAQNNPDKVRSNNAPLLQGNNLF